jgi:uncharacterized membrane protein YhiD involved in acid resistance
MGDNSFTSILILLILFIVLPSVLKFIGQYTLKSKNSERETEKNDMAETDRDMTEYLEDRHYRRDFNHHDKTPVPDKPIKPRWF